MGVGVSVVFAATFHIARKQGGGIWDVLLDAIQGQTRLLVRPLLVETQLKAA